MSDLNLFMMCPALNRSALSALPAGFHFRNCRADELDIWKAMPFDDVESAEAYRPFMTDFFAAVYVDKESLFYEKCLFACNSADEPVGTCFIWKAYDKINTVHWFKVLKGYEGLGIGRSILSKVMRDLGAEEYPVYLHTHPTSDRAIKLYSDFGFLLLSDPVIGSRSNDLDASLPILKRHMPPSAFSNLRVTHAPPEFLSVVSSSATVEF